MLFSATSSHVRCFVSSSRILIGDKSRGQVKRLDLMSLEVMGRTAAAAAAAAAAAVLAPCRSGNHRLQKLDSLSSQAM
jgi:hypothetical protein